MEANRPATSLLLLRVSAVIFAVGMLAAFVWYSQISAQTTVPVAVNGGTPLLLTSKSGTVAPLPSSSASPPAGQTVIRQMVAPLPHAGALGNEGDSMKAPVFEAKRMGISDDPTIGSFFLGEFLSMGWLGPKKFGSLYEPTIAEVFGRKEEPKSNGLAFAEAPADNETVPDLSGLFAAEDESRGGVVMSTSKSGAVFPAYRIKPQRKVIPAPLQDAILIREAMKSLRSSEHSTSTTKP